MSENENKPGEAPPPPPPDSGVRWAKSRLPFENDEGVGKGAATNWGAFIYGALALGLGAFAAYMALIEKHPFTAAHVMAPGIGAAWFALRFAMMLSSR